MGSIAAKRPRSRLFYGWYILVSSFFILFFTSGARYSFGVMFKPMLAEFGWSRSAMSFAFFLNMTCFAFSIVLAGKLYDRYGPRWVIVAATIFLTVGYCLTARVHDLRGFYFTYGILAAIGLGGTSVPLIATLTSKWFVKKRGLAVSLSLAGNCMGQFALLPLFTLFALRFGWRISFLLIGVIIFFVNTTLALFVIRGDPDHLGYEPFGSGGEEKLDRGRGTASSDQTLQDLGLWEAMHTTSFWYFLTLMFICGSGDFIVVTHLIPYVTDHGVSPGTAGHMLAWFGFMSLVGILIAGPVSDRIGSKIPIAFAFLVRVLSFLLVLKYQNPVSFYVFSLTFGLTYLITGPLTPILVGRLFGTTHVGYISGFVSTLHHIGGGFWAYMGGWIFDQTGSYRLAFMLSAAMAFLAMICALLIREERHLSVSQGNRS